LTEANAISLMRSCSRAVAIFCTLAGYLRTSTASDFIGVLEVRGDRHHRPHDLGFILGSEMNLPNLGVWIALSTVS